MARLVTLPELNDESEMTMYWFFGVLGAVTAAFVWWRFYYFLRDPARSTPVGEHLMVAPADGLVTYVKKVSKGDVPIAIKARRSIALGELTAVRSEEDGYLIGIFMSPFSVHRNRAPVSGDVVLRQHQPAPKNISMARMFTNVFVGRTPPEVDCAYIVKNERLTIGIKTVSGAVVTVTQIADAWVNRIIARVSPGDTVLRGQQYGLIRLGSQVDTFVPLSLIDKISIQAGQRVRAGESVLLELKRQRRLLDVREAKAADNVALLELARRNPMVMSVVAYTDRSPDYLGLHKALPGSRAFVGDVGEASPAAACSVICHRGRVGDSVVDVAYCTDFIRNANSSHQTAAARVRDATTGYAAQVSQLAYFAVNEGNKRMMKIVRPSWAFGLTKLQYVDVILTRSRSLPNGVSFSPADSDEKLARALEFLNRAHAKHQLYDPWDVERFYAHAARFTGMKREDVLCAERDGELVGAALLFDPTPFFSVRVLGYDRGTALISHVVRAVNSLTGLLFAPPRLGEVMPTRHLRRFAANEEAGSGLFDYACNQALAAGARSVCFVQDPRCAVPVGSGLVFKYPFVIFGTTNTIKPADWDTTRPVFFDVTYS